MASLRRLAWEVCVVVALSWITIVELEFPSYRPWVLPETSDLCKASHMYLLTVPSKFLPVLVSDVASSLATKLPRDR